MGKELNRHLGLLDVLYEKYSYLIYHFVYCQVRTCSTKPLEVGSCPLTASMWQFSNESFSYHVMWYLVLRMKSPESLGECLPGINGPMTGRGKTTRQIRGWVRVCVTVACFSWMSTSPMPSYCTSSCRLLRAEILLGAATLRAFCYLLSKRTTSRQEKLI